MPDGDLSYYIQESDDFPFLGNAKRIRALTTKRNENLADGETPIEKLLE